MMLRTNMITAISCLCMLALCNASESGWTPLLTASAQRRYGLSSNTHNFVSSKPSTVGYQSSNGNILATTSKYQYGEIRNKQEGPMSNYGVNVNTYKASPSYISAGTGNHQNAQVNNNANLGITENQQQRPYHGMDANFAGSLNGDHMASIGEPLANNKQYGFGNVIKGFDNNFGGTSMSYGGGRNFNIGGVNDLHVATNYKGGSGYDAYGVTSYRGTSGANERKGGDFGKPVVLNYATSRPISYDVFLQNKILDHNRNPHTNIGNNGESIRVVYDQNNNRHPPNNNNNNINNNNDNNGVVKGNDYTNNNGVNHAHVNLGAVNNVPPFNMASNKDHNGFTGYTARGNSGPTSQNNNFHQNNNKINDYRQGSPNGNMNGQLVGPMNNMETSTYAVDDNYIDGPPLSKPHAPQIYHQPAMLPVVNSPFPSIKPPQQSPSLQQFPRPSPDLKPYHDHLNSRPPMASEDYSSSPRPPLQGIPPTLNPMLTATFNPQSPEKLPMRLQQPPQQQQQQIPPSQEMLRNPAPYHQAHQPTESHQHRPEIPYLNLENLPHPNGIIDPIFDHLMRVISNTLFYGDLESRIH